jgi:hypothetical protein
MGKMAIPDEILQKPGPLNEAEWEKCVIIPSMHTKCSPPYPTFTPRLKSPSFIMNAGMEAGIPAG